MATTRAAMQIRLWLTPSIPLDTAREYYVYALNEHLKVWEWLEERFEITCMPEIEVRGQGMVARPGQALL